MEKPRRRNLVEVFKIGKISRNLRSNKSNKISVSCTRKGKQQLSQTNWMVLLLQMIDGMQHMDPAYAKLLVKQVNIQNKKITCWIERLQGLSERYFLWDIFKNI